MTSPQLYMFFEHGGGKNTYSLYKVKKPSDPLPLTEAALKSQIDNPNRLTPTHLFERKVNFPSGMRCVLFRSKFYFLGGENEFEDNGRQEFEFKNNWQEKQKLKEQKKLEEQNKRYPPNVFIFYPATATAASASASTSASFTDTDFFTEATPMKTGKPEPLLLFVANDKMYALSCPHLSLNNSVEYFEVFDPNINTWASLTRPPFFKRGFLDMQHAVVNQKIYIMAGQYRASNDFALHCFDLEKNEWIPSSKLKCPALPLRYSIAGFVQDTVYGCFNETIVGFGLSKKKIVGFGPVQSSEENDDGEIFNHLLRFSPKGPVNYFKRRPMMVDTSSNLMHLGNKRFCYVVSGNPPLQKDPLLEDAADLINDPESRYISLTIFEAHTDEVEDKDGDTCYAKFLHVDHYVAETTWDTGFAVLRDCMLTPEDGEWKGFKGKFVFNEVDLKDPHRFLGQGVSLQLINGDPVKLGKPAYLEEFITSTATYKVTFDWDEGIGVPEAFIVRNNIDSAFHLKTLTLEDVPGQGPIQFDCNVLVYSAAYYIFFANKFLKQEMLHNILDAITGYHGGKNIKGTVVLMKKLGHLDEGLNQRVSLQLISAVNGDTANGGKVGIPAYLEEWITNISPSTEEEYAFKVTFDWDEEIGVPGAFIVRNYHHSEFYLKTLTLEDVPGQGRIHFVCNSWVYRAGSYKEDRVFFANNTYLPSETPMPLRKYREDELLKLRGNRKGKLKECNRVYDYDFYNDLWDPDYNLQHPDEDPQYVRPVLGGSTEYPYPRRGRTGRPLHCKDRNRESRPIIRDKPPLSIYVPRDEQFCRQKMLASLAYQSKLKFLFDHSYRERLFHDTCICSQFFRLQSLSLELKLYGEGIKHNDNCLCKPYLTNNGVVKFPMPQVIKENRSAWRTDEEFAREMLAGVNPVVIRCLQEFPLISKLDPTQSSSITKEDIENKLDGLTIDEAIKTNKLFILDHYDALMPYLWRINNTSTKTYASRTLLFLKDDGTLKPLVIELSKPDREGDKFCAISKVYKPSEGFIWQLAKAYVTVNDSVYHQLISNWLNTHAAIEPFVIATNRQLSVLHPIYKLLHPHFRDTMNINAFARQILINAGGVLESTVFPSKYAMEMSSAVYKNWVFPDQALPEDLKNRGMAVEDSNSPHGLRLLITDYPYAVDGLEIWSSIKTWVEDYCSFYYGTDEKVQKDSELQSWWKELREEGHGDKKDEPWWPQMQTRKELVDTCTIIIWVASALHAAVNFGQYAYAGYVLNRPTVSLEFMPEKASEYDQPTYYTDTVFWKTFTPQMQTLIGISLVEFLSMHSTDEVYLGQRDTPEWTSDEGPLQAFKKFGENLADIEKRIIERNNDKSLKNRVGPVKMPYTLLCPTSKGGLPGKGIPNSVSI